MGKKKASNLSGTIMPIVLLLLLLLGVPVIFFIHAMRPVTFTTQCLPASGVDLDLLFKVESVKAMPSGATQVVLERDTNWGVTEEEERRLRDVADSLAYGSYRRDRLIAGTYESERMLVEVSLHDPPALPKAGDYASLIVFEDDTVQVVFEHFSISSGTDRYALCSEGGEAAIERHEPPLRQVVEGFWSFALDNLAE